MKLTTHSILLQSERVTLRPMTEADWPDLLRWNNDPEVLYSSEGDAVTSYQLADVQDIYRTVSQNALCFIIEFQGRPVGECWLERMNLERVLREYPGYDVRRIDLMIGEKALWGQGLGTEVIGLLSGLAFQKEKADYLFGVDIADNNLASRRAFEKNDFRLVARRRLADLAARQKALPLSFQFHGVFPGANLTTFLGPLVTSPLLELQASVCRLLDDLGELPEFKYYRPGHWIPHCALAMEFDGQRLFEALRIGDHLTLPLSGQIGEISLTEAQPVRHLDTWSLQERST